MGSLKTYNHIEVRFMNANGLKMIQYADRGFSDGIFKSQDLPFKGGSPLLERENVVHLLRVSFSGFPRRKPTIIVDFSRSAEYFWGDYWIIAEMLWSLGMSDIRMIEEGGHIDAGEYRSMSFSSKGSHLSKRKSYKMPESGRVLVLSDFGAYGHCFVRNNKWRSSIRNLKDYKNTQVVGWAPAPVKYCSGIEYCRVIPLKDENMGRERIAERDHGLELLLTALSPAIRVEPFILRQVRRSMALGLEFEGWFFSDSNPHIGKTAIACWLLDPMRYWDKFRTLPEAAQEDLVDALIKKHAKELSPMILAEEVLNWSVLAVNKSHVSDICSAEYLLKCLTIRIFDDRNCLDGYPLSWAKRFVERNVRNGLLWLRYPFLSVLYALVKIDSLENGLIRSDLPEGVYYDEVKSLLELPGVRCSIS